MRTLHCSSLALGDSGHGHVVETAGLGKDERCQQDRHKRVPGVVSAALGALGVILSVVVVDAQNSDAKRATVELTGCVSVTPSEGGQFAFVDAASGGTYRLRGKGINKYAGQRVTIVGNPNSKRVRFRTGLWPSPNIAAQAGALDPAQESIARQPGGAASGAQSSAPELQVVRMRGAEGACR